MVSPHKSWWPTQVTFHVGAAALLIASGLGGSHVRTAFAAPAPNGKTIYDTNCATCHQAQGDGLPDAVPPLAKNAFVAGDPAPVIRIVLNGKQGPLRVNGKLYDATMPAWKRTLKPAEIAAVLSYVRRSFGNTGSAVTEKQVIAAKK